MTGRLVFTILALVLLQHFCRSKRFSDAKDDGPSKRFWWRKKKSAPTKIDVVFMLDSSRRVGRFGFRRGRSFARAALELFTIFPAKTRIATVSYNSKVNLEFSFNTYVDKECVRRRLKYISYAGGSADRGKALEYVRTDLMFNASRGARSKALKVIFLLTDGIHKKNTINPLVPARKLKQKNVKIFVIRVRSHWFKYFDWTTVVLAKIASGYGYVLTVGRYGYGSLYRIRSLLNLASPRRCYGKKTVFDECGRRCKCRRGRLVQCCRLRKEFLDFTVAERRRYIATVKKASTDPAYKTRYEAFLTIHKVYFDSRIHALDFFLPWHRWFILQYENLLREIDCRITVPYWDWSLVGADPFSSDVWHPGPHGLGGNGAGERNCVNTGPFREKVWSVIQSAGGGCLVRDFNGRTPDAVAVKELITSNANASNFTSFELVLRLAFHDSVHCRIDGTMCTIDSASAPEFFLHHGFVDKIWWDWQKQSKNHTFNEYFITQTAIMPATKYRSRDFLDLSNQIGCVCAKYVPSRSTMYKTLQAFSRSQLSSIKRLPMPEMPKKAMKLFKITKDDLHQLHKFMKAMQPRKTLKPSQLSKKDRSQGFQTAEVMGKVKKVSPKA